jgi:alkylation response protein AidB-like acyl-CoA dehydrogenase
VSHYAAPLDEFRFLLEAFDYTGRLQALPPYAEFDTETAMALLEQVGTWATEVLAPLNRPGDTTGVHLDDERQVRMPEGFRDAYQQLVEQGFAGLIYPAEHGGLGAPKLLGSLAGEIMTATNKSFSMCAALTGGVAEALHLHGDDELKARYLDDLTTGAVAGTMCLTEPHSGSDLGLLTTKATPTDDGMYALEGSKIWITFGDHDLTDNILHMVLARLPDAPAGIKGISTFLVPKFLPDGTRNEVWATGLEHKLGIHASPTCAMAFEGAKGWLMGAPHKGMRVMFTMMNAARLAVGVEGVGLGDAAYQAALSFCRDRKQGRALDRAKREGGTADTILVHPDVRRQLLWVKSTTEGLRALAVWIAILQDEAEHHEDEAVRQRADHLVALLTPVIKAYGSKRGFLNVSDAMQVMGGAGYTADWPVEQLLRDVRIAMIYEGTNHIQALDLVGRKLPMDGGAPLRAFAEELQTTLAAAMAEPAVAPWAEAVAKEAARLQETTMNLAGAAFEDAEVAGASADAYLEQLALVTLGLMWLRLGLAVAGREEGDATRRGKLQTGRFFVEQVLPEATLMAKRVAAGKGAVSDIDTDLL